MEYGWRTGDYKLFRAVLFESVCTKRSRFSQSRTWSLKVLTGCSSRTTVHELCYEECDKPVDASTPAAWCPVLSTPSLHSRHQFAVSRCSLLECSLRIGHPLSAICWITNPRTIAARAVVITSSATIITQLAHSTHGAFANPVR